MECGARYLIFVKTVQMEYIKLLWTVWKSMNWILDTSQHMQQIGQLLMSTLEKITVLTIYWAAPTITFCNLIAQQIQLIKPASKSETSCQWLLSHELERSTSCHGRSLWLWKRTKDCKRCKTYCGITRGTGSGGTLYSHSMSHDTTWHNHPYPWCPSFSLPAFAVFLCFSFAVKVQIGIYLIINVKVYLQKLA